MIFMFYVSFRPIDIYFENNTVKDIYCGQSTSTVVASFAGVYLSKMII